MSYYEKMMRGAEEWIGFYRANPHRFVEDYLHIRLKLFQKILLFMMCKSKVTVNIATRGQGKTFIMAIFACVMGILYPGTKICIASGTRGQSINVLEKIAYELRPNSHELEAEIEKFTINGTNAVINFKNGSWIKVVTASDNARGNRAHILIIDEFRMVKKDTIDTVLSKFLSSPRSPIYASLSDDEKTKVISETEDNKTVYASSAYFQDHWSFNRCKDSFRAMLGDKHNHFISGLPWQLSVSEGLLKLDDVADQMAETDFNEVKWAMEMEAVFVGAFEGSFFDYNVVSKNRNIKYPMLPDNLAEKLGFSQKVKIQPKQNGEMRILSADIALMSSKKHANDATAIFVNQMLPTKANRYTSNIVYSQSCEGLRTEEQALVIRRLFDEYACDYIVLDCAGIGLGVYDCLARDMLDTSTGEIYPAISCCNDKIMAERCTSVDAEKVIWSVKASAQFNSDCAFLLREGFKSGRIRLLETEYDADESLSAIKGYSSLNPQERIQLQLPYINTTLLIDELTKLEHEEAGGKVKVKERTGMRKDRYSSLAYNYYVAIQLEAKMGRKNKQSAGAEFIVKPPTGGGRTVRGNNGSRRKNSWR